MDPDLWRSGPLFSGTHASLMTVERVALVRHGEIDRGALESFGLTYSGARFDFVPLSPVGIRQAEQAAEALAASRPRLVLTSPYTRTLQTAAILSRDLGCPLTVDLRLHDWLPVRDGTSAITRTLVEEKVEEYERWTAGEPLPSDRTWESAGEMRARLVSAVQAHLHVFPLVVVTHEAPIQSLIGPSEVALGSLHHVPVAALGLADPV